MKNLKKKQKQKKSLKVSKTELDFLNQYSSIIGIDEVGRGCMAGPMVIAGFKLTLDHTPVKYVHDSKIVDKNTREELFPILTTTTHHIHEATIPELNAEGLSQPFKRAVIAIREALSDENSLIIVDGNLKFKEFDNIVSIVDADALLYSVAAASIIAKVYRDNLMTDFGKRYPEYGFESHVGYATKKHRDAVMQHGVLDIHRVNYKFIRELPERRNQLGMF